MNSNNYFIGFNPDSLLLINNFINNYKIDNLDNKNSKKFFIITNFDEIYNIDLVNSRLIVGDEIFEKDNLEKFISFFNDDLKISFIISRDQVSFLERNNIKVFLFSNEISTFLNFIY